MTSEEISPEKVERLRNIVAKYNVDTWENEFNGPYRDTTGSVGWNLSFELEDGSVICYTGDAEYFSDFNNDMRDV